MTASSLPSVLAGRKVLLIIGGGIAAYKALELIRLLSKAGAKTMTVLTKAGAEFVTPMSLAALTGHPVRQDLFMPEDETAMGHIELSRWADLVVVAPATAGLIAKAANGMADDLASTTLLATDKKVLLAPAMNVRMWLHPAVQANVARLKSFDGFQGMAVVGPDDGIMACGEFGPGRMAEPPVILDAIARLLAGPDGRPLTGRTAVVTAGPTFEPI
ncbi:MAG TPA: bifunctional phosphopantothenoylcysteine decarboxylase/phosphopantothenate synthase, partial [Brevundimonas sp.]|nr:bifunctional phosphopantothenoylcysteine decarboxylase/phosphopantothenate synthase [Brevundimonas sp.]